MEAPDERDTNQGIVDCSGSLLAARVPQLESDVFARLTCTSIRFEILSREYRGSP